MKNNGDKNGSWHLASKRAPINVLMGVVLLGAGVLVGWAANVRFYRPQNGNGTTVSGGGYIRGVPVREADNNYKLINPLLLCEVGQSKEIQEFKPMKEKIQQSEFDTLNNPDIYSMSVYFRDFTTGRWLGINENAVYDPASLLKVPLMMAYFKEAESGLPLLSEKLFYKGEPEDQKGIEFHTLIPNTWYTVEELLRAMIVKSDNDAKDILFSNMDLGAQNEVFGDLGIQVPSDPNARYQISAKTYSEFFRILYNSTYLSREYSEKALELLSEADFNGGIAAGIPAGTDIAHKFGQFQSPSPRSAGGAAGLEWQLHDCGIVYYPQRNYLLCVMTMGDDLSKLQNMIKNVSSIVYQEVSSGYK